MKIVYFTHSLRSCWNHGNAHFLRGVLRDLTRRGHDVQSFETAHSWSLDNLVRDHGPAGLRPFELAYPDLKPSLIDRHSTAELERACDGADLVIVHEWNEPAMVAAIGRLRRRARFTLLFHDTHHRAVSDPDAIRAFDLRTTTAFSRLEKLCPKSTGTGVGATVSSPGTKRRTSPSSIHPNNRSRDEDWSGSATGATANAPRSWKPSCSIRRKRRSCHSTSTAYAIRTRPRRCSAASARATTDGSPTPLRPRCSRATSRPYTCPGGSIRAIARRADDPGVRSPGLRSTPGQRTVARF